ncbi:sarcoplasmic calcium-binding protein 2 [Anticarsia gemmatalis]|uniref:sarcoplasmic calcium-binding protein 2 n=1 Tax=Anticarsia gemmatalis TaxID=129554 RepID=UPI001EA633B3|nr:juvenile hormone diol kinase [Anticarsia gemmatalis]
MSVSEFRRKKLLYVFNVFFDVNQSGTIERKDFELAIEKICHLRGWKPGDPKNTETHEIMIKIWDGLRKRADSNKDGQVSVEEWVSMWNDYAQNPSAALKWQQLYAQFMFQLEDASADGTIDSDEFTTVCSSYGIDPQECKVAFTKMAKGKSSVSWEEFQELWKEYFSTEDPNAPGNFIFGRTSF